MARATMNPKARLGRLVVASWILSGQDSRLPARLELLDVALKRASDKGAFAGERMDFVDTGETFACVQTQAILDLAQEAGLTSAPNPSYRSTDAKINDVGAFHIVSQLGVPVETAKAWGKLLAQAVAEAREELDPFAHH